MKPLPVFLLAFVFSSMAVAQQVDDIYENLETRARFRILDVVSSDNLRASYSKILKMRAGQRSTRLAKLKKQLEAECDEQFAKVQKRYEMNKQYYIEILNGKIRSKEENIRDLSKSDTADKVVKALIEDKRTSIASDMQEIASIDSAMETWGELNVAKQEYLKNVSRVDSIAKSRVREEDLTSIRYASQVKSGETYVIVTTDAFRIIAIDGLYVPFSLINKNRLYKKIN